MSEELLTIDEASDYLRVHPETCRRLASKGRIPCGKVGRAYVFVKSDLLEYIRAQYNEPTRRSSGSSTGDTRWLKKGTTRKSTTPTSTQVDVEYASLLGLQSVKTQNALN